MSDTDIIAGDAITWTEPVYGSYSPGFGGRRGRAKPPIGERTISATVERESYGDLTGQHTFSLRVLAAEGCQAPEVGTLIRRMGRNLYGNLVKHGTAADAERQARADNKHLRGDYARGQREVNR